MDLGKTKWIMFGVGAASVAILVTALVLRKAPKGQPERKHARAPSVVQVQDTPDGHEGPIVTVAQPKPDFQPAPPKELGKALDQASIRSLLDNLRVASESEDDATMRAMIEGLRRRGDSAKALVEHELAQVPPDSKTYFAYKQVLK